MASLLSQLQQKTARYLATQNRKMAKIHRADQQTESRRLRGEPARARKIIAGIYDLAAAEADQGSTFAMVMKLSHHVDFIIPPSDEDQHPDTLRPEMLRGAAKIVYDYCLRQKFKVSLEWWNSETCLGLGIEWTKSKPIKRPVKKSQKPAAKKPAAKKPTKKAAK